MESRSAERGVTERLIISRIAAAGDIDLALQLANQLDLGPNESRGPVYSWILQAMARGGKLDRVGEAVQQCVQADGSFPYAGVVALIKSGQLDGALAITLSREGIANASSQASAVGVNSGAAFLNELHSVLPAIDANIEDAATAMLGTIRRQRRSSAYDRRSDTGTENELLAIIEGVDPDRARDLRPLFPEGAVPPPPGLRVETDAYGRVSSSFGPDPATRLSREAATDPDLALKQAGQGTDYELRFRALVAIAAVLSTSDRRRAAIAADSALEVLGDHRDLLSGEINSTVSLAGTLDAMGEDGLAAELVGQCLDEADRLAARADQQFEALPPLRQARALGQLTLAEIPIAHVYEVAVRVAPGQALRRASALPSRFLKPAVLAHVAAGMAAAQADRQP